MIICANVVQVYRGRDMQMYMSSGQKEDDGMCFCNEPQLFRDSQAKDD